jgi:Na+/H+ antiporter NhaD/arsenite permease-like protein
MFFALAVFLAVLILFAVDLVHRTPAALAGAILLVVVGGHRPGGGHRGGPLGDAGAPRRDDDPGGHPQGVRDLRYLAIMSAQAAGGRPGVVLIYLALITAVLSAFLDNVTTVLLMFPVTLVIARIMEENPIPYLIVEVLASNMGARPRSSVTRRTSSSAR